MDEVPQHRRPSASLIVSMIALFVALSGVATGAGRLGPNSVKSSNIAPGAVTTSDIHADAVTATSIRRSAVTTSELRTGAVGSTDLAPAAVTEPALAPASVDEAAIAPLAVSGGKLKDDAVTTRTLQDDAVTTQVVAPGAIPPSRLSQFPSVRLTTAADVSVPTSTFLAPNWDTEVYDVNNMHSTVTNPGRINIPTAGIYRITVNWEWNPSSMIGNGIRRIGIYRNSSLTAANIVGNRFEYNVPPGVTTPQTLSVAFNFNAGDFFEVYAIQGAGETLTLDQNSGASPVVSAEWVAPPQ